MIETISTILSQMVTLSFIHGDISWMNFDEELSDYVNGIAVKDEF